MSCPTADPRRSASGVLAMQQLAGLREGSGRQLGSAEVDTDEGARR